MIITDNVIVGNLIGERVDSIIVEKDQTSENVYVIPKTKVNAYNVSQIVIITNESKLRLFEEGRNEGKKGEIDKKINSVTNTISEKANQAKEKIVETKDKLVDKTKEPSEKVK